MKINLLLFIIFIATNAFAQNIDLNIGKTKSKNYYTEISIEFIKDKILVPVEIEDKTYRFILDTGAPNMISKEIQDLINPKVITSIPTTDASGKKENLNVVTLEALKFGDILFEQTATLVYDLNANPIFECFGIDGIIGSNMLRNSIIQIDIDQKRIRLTDNKKTLSLSHAKSSRIKFVDAQSSPYVWIKLSGEYSGKEQVLLDTGMDGLYDISYEKYNVFKNEKIFNVIGESEGASSIGLFGDSPLNEHLRLHLPILIINGIEIENCITTTINDNNSRIGAEFLKYGVVTIDFKNRRFYFQAKSTKIDVHQTDFGFTRTIKDEKLVVGFVWDEVLKEKISYGDEIIEINESPINICDLIAKYDFFENNESVKLKIKPKEGEIFELVIHKTTPFNQRPTTNK